ncbi:hypothetical protein NQ315_002810 [Exocentrus adspersus]|uniref:Uncharacterized protein n=1 Tax=Exocentrus adspersus TaxID=1586481 RepID=A0AAV8VJL5_9CUCU|nr:hypothetical protein NQ315_002810 [Exocentrus adspersus]
MLGLLWCLQEDTLTINGENLKQVINVDVRIKPVTKRLFFSGGSIPQISILETILFMLKKE